METSTKSKMILFGEEISGRTKDVFSERARWVQTWIVSWALPFISLLIIVFSYYQIGSAIVSIPKLLVYLIAVPLLILMLSCAVRPILKHQWSRLFGHYKPSMTFLALLLIFGSPQTGHPLQFWGIVVLGFWLIGLFYPKRWLVPGEFATIAIMVAGLCIGSTPPIAKWLYSSLVFVPVIVWLQWKGDSIKAVLLLSALLLVVWIESTIEGWGTVLATFGALALLSLSVYVIRRLRENASSSLLISVGYAIISGLLLFIFLKLFGFDPERARTWWAMYLIFSMIILLLPNRECQSQGALSILWAVHWAVITLLATFDSWLESDRDMLWAVHIVPMVGAFILAISASKLDNSRLYAWARLYVAVAITSIYIVIDTYGESAINASRFVYLAALFLTVLWFSRFVKLQRAPPWWVGVTSPRHVVATRRIFRNSGNFIGSIPVIGAILSVVFQGLLVTAKLKRRNGFHSGDIMLILLIPIFAVIISQYLSSFAIDQSLAAELLLRPDSEHPINVPPDTQKIDEVIGTMTQISIYIISGLLFGIVALSHREPLYAMLGMISFIIAPITLISSEYVNTGFFWLTCLGAAVGIVSIRTMTLEIGIKS